MKTFGVGFMIGAALAPTVNTAFSTMSQKIKATRSEISRSSAEAKALGNALTTESQLGALQTKRLELGTRIQTLRQEKSAGKAGAGMELSAAQNQLRTLKSELKRAESAHAKTTARVQTLGIATTDYEQAQKKATAALNVQHGRMERMQTLEQQKDKRKNLRGQLLDTSALVMSVAAPVRMAMDFESAMADAAKTIDGMRDSSGKLTPKYHEMTTAVKEMGREIPLTHEQIAGLFAIGGQQGMSGTQDLKEFSTLAAHMSVAFGMGTEESAEAIGGYRTALGLSMPQTREMLDLMNHYANTGSASEKGIAEVMRRVGGLGDVAGLSYKPMVALAATMDAMKIAPENAATGIQKLLLTMSKGTAATKAQKNAFAKLGFHDTSALAKKMQEDGTGAIMSVLRAVKRMPAHEQASMLTQLFGEEGVRTIAPLLSQLDLLEENLRTSADSTKYLGATEEEFKNRSQTAAHSLQLFKNRGAELALTLGSVVLPPLVALMETLGPMISGIASFAEANKGLTTGLVGLFAGFVAMKALMLGISYVGSGLKSVWTGCTGTLSWLTDTTHGHSRAARAQRTAVTHSAGAFSQQARDARRAKQATRGATSALRTQVTVARTAGRAMRVLGGSWKFFLGPVGAIISVLEVLYNTFEPVRNVVDWIIDCLSTLPVIGPIIKKVAGALGFGGEELEALDPLETMEETGKSLPDTSKNRQPDAQAPTAPVESALAPNEADYAGTAPISTEQAAAGAWMDWLDAKPKQSVQAAPAQTLTPVAAPVESVRAPSQADSGTAPISTEQAVAGIWMDWLGKTKQESVQAPALAAAHAAPAAQSPVLQETASRPPCPKSRPKHAK